jgi:NAD(P)-dependent dehydrogenase (short-subunit alcohol dehydrogenase family)
MAGRGGSFRSRALNENIHETPRFRRPIVCAAPAGDPVDGAQHVHRIDIWPKISARDSAPRQRIGSLLHDAGGLLIYVRGTASHGIQCWGNNSFRSNVVNEHQHPGPERFDRRQLGGELSLCLSQLFYLAYIDSGQQVIARRKVTVERARADLGALSYLIHAGLRASAGENQLGDFENPLTVALRVGSGFAGGLLCGGSFHRAFLNPERLSGNLIGIAEIDSVLFQAKAGVKDFVIGAYSMAAQFGANSTTDDVLEGIDLKGKRILVTGVSAGIGVETARALVAHGADVVGAARDLEKARRATSEVNRAAAKTGASLEVVELDLASLKSVRSAADKLVADGRLFDVIIANAGVMATPLGKTEDGFETQFGTNHLGHFVFVNRIAKLIKDGGRLVNLSSSGHRFSNVDLSDPNFETTQYEPFVAYGRSKTANILFAVAFDQRHRARGVRAAAVHPGGIQTELARHMDPAHLEQMVSQINEQAAAEGKGPFQFKTVPQGAATSVWAAVVASAGEVGGRYCENCHVSDVVADEARLGMLDEGVRGYALDPENAKALWKKSEELVGEAFA